MSGALNPIHKAHVKASLLGARAIEEQFGIPGNTSWNLAHHLDLDESDQKKNNNKKNNNSSSSPNNNNNNAVLTKGKVKVIGCALVPSSDGYVMSKLGKGNALTCAMRCKLTDAACIEETKHYLNKVQKYCIDVMKKVEEYQQQELQKNDDEDSSNDNKNIIKKILRDAEDQLEHFFPLICLPYNQASASWCCRLLEKELSDCYNGEEDEEEEQQNKNKSKNKQHQYNFKALRLYGSDFSMKYRQYRDMICIERHDSEKSGEHVKKIVKANKEVGDNFIFVTQDPNRDVFAGTSNCSSTAIRQALILTASSNQNTTTPAAIASSSSPKDQNNNNNNDDENVVDSPSAPTSSSTAREILSPMLHTEVMETMIELTQKKMEAEQKLAEERKKKEEMIAFYKENRQQNQNATTTTETKETKTKKKNDADKKTVAFDI